MSSYLQPVRYLFLSIHPNQARQAASQQVSSPFHFFFFFFFCPTPPTNHLVCSFPRILLDQGCKLPNGVFVAAASRSIKVYFIFFFFASACLGNQTQVVDDHPSRRRLSCLQISSTYLDGSSDLSLSFSRSSTVLTVDLSLGSGSVSTYTTGISRWS